MNRSVQMMSIALVVSAATFAVTMFSAPAQGTRSLTIEPSSIGSVDTFALIDVGIMTEERESVREEYGRQGDEVLTPLYEADASFKAQLNAMDPNDPLGSQIYQQFQQNQAQLNQLSQQINTGYQDLIASQIAELYKEVYAATNEVAAEHGYTYVFSTRHTSELVQVDSIQGVTQEILARPLVTPPEATNITELVRVKLGLPTMEEIEAANQAKADAAQAALDAAAQAEGSAEAPDESAEESSDAVEVEPADQP